MKGVGLDEDLRIWKTDTQELIEGICFELELIRDGLCENNKQLEGVNKRLDILIHLMGEQNNTSKIISCNTFKGV